MGRLPVCPLAGALLFLWWGAGVASALNTGAHTSGGCINTHRQNSSQLRLAPTPLEEESARAAEEKEDTNNPLNRFILNTAVRSTSQTDAITVGRKRQTSATEDEDDEGVPSEVLRPFSLLLLSQFVLFIGVGAVIPTIPLYGQTIGLSSTSNGVVISAPAVALLLVSRWAGEYADRGRKGAMLWGMACIAISDTGTALSNSLATLVLARLGLGLGRGYAEAGERGMLTDLANKAPQLRGRALALQQASVALGIALGAPIGGVIVEEYGARAAFLCVSAAAVFALVIYAILPETVAGEVEAANGQRSNLEESTSDSTQSDEADWARLLQTSPTWRALAVSQSGVSFGFACKIAVIPILANAYLGGATGAGLLVSAAGLAGLVGAPMGGFLTDKVGSRIAAAVAGTIGGVSLALVPVGLSLKETSAGDQGSLFLEEGLASSSSFWQSILTGLASPEAIAFTLLVLLWSIGASAQGPALTALAQEKAPLGSEATALGLPRAVGDGTYIIAPLILGYVSDQLGDAVPGAACTVAGGAICLGSIGLLLLSPEDDA
ncbi:hypothetical protein ACHAXT_012657 [Thalassiosira profunda]